MRPLSAILPRQIPWVAAAVCLLLPAVARAGGGGTGIPETAGPGAGAASADARGLYYNPAAALGANGNELWLDLSAEVLSVHYQRAGTNPRDGNPFPGTDSLNVAPVPHIAFRSDSFARRKHASSRLGADEARVGLGFTIAAPFGRQVTYKGDYPGRYHLVKVNFFNAYLIPSVAVRATHALRFGVGPIIVVSQYDITQRVDLAPQLAALDPGGTPPPAESALLEGQIEFHGARGVEPGFTAGVLYDVGDVATIGLGFLSGSISTATGKAKVTPSLDIAVHADSDLKLTKKLPPILNLGARIRPPDSPVEISLEAQYVGWHVVDADEVTLSNSKLRGDNADVQTLLNVLNVNQGTLVSGILDQKQTIARGYHDSFNVILGAEYIYKPFRTRFEIGYDRSAIPDEDVNPGNLDFDSLVLGAATRWEPKEKPFLVQLAISQYLNNGRSVKNSKFDTYADPASGYAFPSGNGTYSAVLTRIGVSMGYRF